MNMTTPVAHPDFNVDLYARDFKYFFEMKKFDYNICFPRQVLHTLETLKRRKILMTMTMR